jgi:hypothetical protein
MDIEFDEAQLREAALPPRRQVAAPLLQILREKIEEMLRLQVIVPSTWWFQSPVVIVKQKGKYRFCTDYRHLNRFTRPLKFPIPLNRDTFQMFRGKRILTSLDNRKGYYQLKLAAAAMLWTTFYTPIGSFMYTRIPFGLVSAPAYYNFLMATIVLIGLIGRICVSYFDDTAVFSKTHEQHLSDLREVFERFVRYRLTLNGKKCQIAVSSVHFWGHVIDASGFNHLPERQQQAFSFPRPTTKKQMERFIGLATYFSFHIPAQGTTTFFFTTQKARKRVKTCPTGLTQTDAIRQKRPQTTHKLTTFCLLIQMIQDYLKDEMSDFKNEMTDFKNESRISRNVLQCIAN